jgi:hypothetical protein
MVLVSSSSSSTAILHINAISSSRSSMQD